MAPSRQLIQQVFEKNTADSDVIAEDLQKRLENKLLRERKLLKELCKRPAVGLTEVRRDGKDTEAVANVIAKEFKRCVDGGMSQQEFVNHMHNYAHACWVSAPIQFGFSRFVFELVILTSI